MGGEQVRGPEHKGMTAAPKSGSTLKSLCGKLWVSRSAADSEKADVSMGSNGQMHHRSPPGYGSRHLEKDSRR